jgi:hypothetical protein
LIVDHGQWFIVNCRAGPVFVFTMNHSQRSIIVSHFPLAITPEAFEDKQKKFAFWQTRA